MTLYNYTEILVQNNSLEQLIVINAMAGNLLISTIYFGAGIALIVGIYQATKEIDQAMAIGGFGLSLLGALLWFSGLISIYPPFVFLTFALMGVVLRIASGGGGGAP